MTYTTKITQQDASTFWAIALGDDRPLPGMPMRSYATRNAAERGAAKMLAKVAA